MNEVTNTRLATTLVTGAASSKGTVNKQAEAVTQTGNNLPEKAEQSVVQQVEHTAKERQRVETAVASINDFIQSVQRDLRFTVDEELDRTIIKVIDSGSGDLIRQIPEEVFLELARKLKDDGEFQLVNALG